MEHAINILNAAFDIIPAGIIVLDENALIVYLNKTALSMVNKEHSQVLGCHFGEVFNCNNAAAHTSSAQVNNSHDSPCALECTNCEAGKAIALALKSGQATNAVELHKILYNNDDIIADRWFNINVTPVLTDGKTNVIVTLYDITEKKKEQKAVKAAAEKLNRYLELAENADDIILFTDINGKIIDANNAAVKCYGYSYEELCSMNFVDLHIKTDQNCVNNLSPGDKTNAYAYDMAEQGIFCPHTVCIFEMAADFLGVTNFVDAACTLRPCRKYDYDDTIVFDVTTKPSCEENSTGLAAHASNFTCTASCESGCCAEELHRRKDGTCFCVEVCTQVTQVGDRIINVNVIKDVTRRKTMERKLKEQEELFRTVFEQSPTGMAFYSTTGEILDANPVYLKIFGRTLDELKQLSCEGITHPDDLNKDAEKYARFQSGDEKTFSTIKRFLKPDGSVVWGDFSLTSLRVMKCRSCRKQINIAMVEDITEHIDALKKLHESERFKETLLSNIPGMVYRCKYDRYWTMQFVSNGCYDLTGYKPESLINNRDLSFNDLINPEYRDYLWNKWTEILAGSNFLKEEYTITTATGDIKWVFEQGRGVHDENGNVIALEGIIIDITDRKMKENEIQYLNHHDLLTGLYNRHYFDQKMAELNNEKILPVSVITGDINGLKRINDALSYKYGDELIAAVSKIMQGCIAGQGIVARTGGDSFSIILPLIDMDGAKTIMRQLESACNEYMTKSSKPPYRTSISFGYATRTRESETLKSILKRAEDGMYSDKLLQKESIYNSIISSMQTSLLEKSQETEEHALRMIKLSRAIGFKLKLSDEELNELELLSTLHDIGKIGVSDNIINKPGELTGEERAIMCRHPEIGYRIAMTSKTLIPITGFILSHHERYDGRGYPRGLKGKDIPLLSRIISVVDAYDAMTEDRPYRKAMSREEAICEIKANAGTQFDPDIARIFIDIITNDEIM